MSEQAAKGRPVPPDDTSIEAAELRGLLRDAMANPDDPVVPRPPADARGLRPGPGDRGAQGRVAIVQGQIYLVGAIVIAQLFLVTTALHELLSGDPSVLWWIALASLIGFLLALLIMFWPRSRIRGY